MQQCNFFLFKKVLCVNGMGAWRIMLQQQKNSFQKHGNGHARGGFNARLFHTQDMPKPS